MASNNFPSARSSRKHALSGDRCAQIFTFSRRWMPTTSVIVFTSYNATTNVKPAVVATEYTCASHDLRRHLAPRSRHLAARAERGFDLPCNSLVALEHDTHRGHRGLPSTLRRTKTAPTTTNGPSNTTLKPRLAGVVAPTSGRAAHPHEAICMGIQPSKIVHQVHAAEAFAAMLNCENHREVCGYTASLAMLDASWGDYYPLRANRKTLPRTDQEAISFRDCFG